MMTLGKLKHRGENFLVFMDVTTGKVYIYEAFAFAALGDLGCGLSEVKTDEQWGMLSAAAQKYGLTSLQHMALCLEVYSIDTPAAKAIKAQFALEGNAL